VVGHDVGTEQCYVPAGICDNCEEYHLSEEVALKVYAVADLAVRSGAEVEILRFAA
jgi:hypothetical protein